MSSHRWDLSKSEAKLQELEAVLKGAGKRKVLILCHNNPDPDTIAGAYAFSFLLNKKFGVRSILGYGGVVTRAENKAMIQRLRIRMHRLSKLVPARYYGMAVVDAQPGTGNNLFHAKEAQPFIVIDHHPLRKMSLKAEFHDIRPNYGSTSTIVTEYLLAAGLTPTRSVANALLYGLKTDTWSLVRASSREDFEAFNYLSPLTNPRVLGWIERPPLSEDYFRDYHQGLSNALIYRDVAVSFLGKIRSEDIIPALADLLLRTEGVRISLCMGELANMIILSLRSRSRTHVARTLIRSLVGNSGQAGGHKEMAGGQVPLSGLTREEKKGMPAKLIARFLKLVNRPSISPRRLVDTAGTRSSGLCE
ncbi:MAG: DHH family phosphoesterase [Deltaproteobacteria bacterium]|nr:DHH family phosphoesterase [Deltaproteobacteria bacterium]